MNAFPPSFQCVRPPAMTNAERQAEFRKRNPGYYGRLHRKRKAERLARFAAVAQVPVERLEVLMLPAPVEAIEIPGMTTIRKTQRDDIFVSTSMNG